MAIFFFLGKATDFPLAPFFVPELNEAPWTEDFRIISKSAYQIFINQKISGIELSRKNLLIQQLEKLVKEKRFNFSEIGYLDSNIDIIEAVEAKKFTSGLHHYLAHGISENRPADFTFALKVKEAEMPVRIIPSEKLITKLPENCDQCVQVMSVNDYSSIALGIPYSDRKLKSTILHQIYFCDSWLAYDLAWNIFQKIVKEAQNINEYIETVKL
jgi:hypothetical protein